MTNPPVQRYAIETEVKIVESADVVAQLSLMLSIDAKERHE
jgi:hypothetical protein